MPSLTPRQLSCLQWAVENAAAMRGMLTGGPPELLEEFNRNIATARAAVAALQPTPTTKKT
jgi:uncharacterized alpha-E superfamily protein